MLRKPSQQQTTLEMVSLDGLVPKDHLLRKIWAVIDFSFIHDRVAGLYCPDNGRPPLDPTVLFKALFIGYLFGVRSERQLVREIEVNVAYRWFLGLKLTDSVFDASTLSQNRRRRYNDTAVAQDIFDAIVEQAIARGLVDSTLLNTDSTHLKANANKNRYDTPSLPSRARITGMRWMPPSRMTGKLTARSRCRTSPAPRSRRRPRSPALILRAATWCATANQRASSISITAPWTGGSVSSPIRALDKNLQLKGRLTSRYPNRERKGRKCFQLTPVRLRFLRYINGGRREK